MGIESRKKRIYAEQEKVRHTTHWDMDYLPRVEKNGRPKQAKAAVSFSGLRLYPPKDCPGKKETGDNQGHAPDAVFMGCQDSSRTIRTVLARFSMEIGFSRASRMPLALNFTWSSSPLNAE